MGDRGNILFKYEDGNKIYFYTHWRGSDLEEILKSALIRGKDRWDDDQYLGRIVFCEMIKDDVMETTGFGISPYLGDGDDKIFTVDVKNKTVNNIPFEEFIVNN